MRRRNITDQSPSNRGKEGVEGGKKRRPLSHCAGPTTVRASNFRQWKQNFACLCILLRKLLELFLEDLGNCSEGSFSPRHTHARACMTHRSKYALSARTRGAAYSCVRSASVRGRACAQGATSNAAESFVRFVQNLCENHIASNKHFTNLVFYFSLTQCQCLKCSERE